MLRLCLWGCGDGTTLATTTTMTMIMARSTGEDNINEYNDTGTWQLPSGSSIYAFVTEETRLRGIVRYFVTLDFSSAELYGTHTPHSPASVQKGGALVSCLMKK